MLDSVDPRHMRIVHHRTAPAQAGRVRGIGEKISFLQVDKSGQPAKVLYWNFLSISFSPLWVRMIINNKIGYVKKISGLI